MTNLKQLAQETLHIVQTGILPNGKNFKELQDVSMANSQVLTPDTLHDWLKNRKRLAKFDTKTEVWASGTHQAGYRLLSEGAVKAAILNFASAKNVGGGFLGGAKAQEEDLCRASGLYLCQLGMTAYYHANKQSSLIYTDHMIYSPDVPFFRLNHDDVLDDVFTLSVLTAPAPNMGAYLSHSDNPNTKKDVETALHHRAGLVLGALERLGHRTIVLGAWGCGVFKNDPKFVANSFKVWLDDEFGGAFERVVFAIYDKSKTRATLQAFVDVFGE